MSDQFTENLNLKLLDYDSYADLKDINENNQKIDEAFHNLNSANGVALEQVTVLSSSATYSVGATVTFNGEFVNCLSYYGRLKGNSTAMFYSMGSAGALNMISYAFPSTTQTAIRIVRLEKTATDTDNTRTVMLIKQIIFRDSVSGTVEQTNLQTIEIGPIYGYRKLNPSLKSETEVE